LLNLPKKFLIIKREVAVSYQDKWAKIVPHNNLTIDATISFDHPKIKKQRLVFDFSCISYFKEIARARTFGMLSQLDALRKAGLAKGGSLDNAIVLDNFNVLNQDGLRFNDEFVRHKILDTIGDIGLTGLNVVGKIVTYKSGHMLHNLICHQIFSSSHNYEILTAAELEDQLTSPFELGNANILFGLR
jgi:UDP-3-O-[3-hydroxymyristoyl] N-acetylglucosamine deacetylase